MAAIDDDNIQTAVDLWISNETQATSTYGHISGWDTSSVTDMKNLFKDADEFNDDITAWDTCNVTDMEDMFNGAEAFNQNIRVWPISSFNVDSGSGESDGFKNMFKNADAFKANTDVYTYASSGDDWKTTHWPNKTYFTSWLVEERGDIAETLKTDLSTLKTAHAAASSAADRKIKKMASKTKLDNILKLSNKVNSIEIDADLLVLSDEFSADKIIVTNSFTTVTDAADVVAPCNFYCTLSADGDWVKRVYNAGVVNGEPSFTLKVLRGDVTEDGVDIERHTLSIEDASITWGKLGAVKGDTDWSGRFDASDGSGYLLPGDKVIFNGTNNNEYIIIGSGGGGSNGSSICFLGDTKVKTDQGLVRFDALTLDNTVNNYKINKITKVKNADNYMICIEKNALGENVPNKDTYISKNHGIIINNLLVRAKLLVNGTTIRKAYRTRDVIYNILAEVYTIIYVNNMPCETLNPDDPMVKKYI